MYMDYTAPHIPIFIITHNRLEVLKRSVDSYEKSISHPIRIVFFNVASTYQPTLDYMAIKEQEGCKVYTSEINNHKLVINAIKDYLHHHPQCEYYVVTDPDVEVVVFPELEIYVAVVAKADLTGIPMSSSLFQ